LDKAVDPKWIAEQERIAAEERKKEEDERKKRE
jgi:hypothetical protein